MQGVRDFRCAELRPLNTAVPAFYPETAKKDTAVVPDQPQSYERRLKELMKREVRAKNAAEAIESLPAPGFSHHGIMNGGWDVWSVVPRVLDLIAPAKIAEINISTLGYSPQASAELMGLMDGGQVRRATFLCSHYFRSHYGELVEQTDRELAERGGRFAVCRTHAKVICMETTDGRYLVFEGSANLRECRNVEQYALIHDRGLLEWHRGWMLDLLDKVWEAK